MSEQQQPRPTSAQEKRNEQTLALTALRDATAQRKRGWKPSWDHLQTVFETVDATGRPGEDSNLPTDDVKRANALLLLFNLETSPHVPRRQRKFKDWIDLTFRSRLDLRQWDPDAFVSYVPPWGEAPDPKVAQIRDDELQTIAESSLWGFLNRVWQRTSDGNAESGIYCLTGVRGAGKSQLLSLLRTNEFYRAGRDAEPTRLRNLRLRLPRALRFTKTPLLVSFDLGLDFEESKFQRDLLVEFRKRIDTKVRQNWLTRVIWPVVRVNQWAHANLGWLAFVLAFSLATLWYLYLDTKIPDIEVTRQLCLFGNGDTCAKNLAKFKPECDGAGECVQLGAAHLRAFRTMAHDSGRLVEQVLYVSFGLTMMLMLSLVMTVRRLLDPIRVLVVAGALVLFLAAADTTLTLFAGYHAPPSETVQDSVGPARPALEPAIGTAQDSVGPAPPALKPAIGTAQGSVGPAPPAPQPAIGTAQGSVGPAPPAPQPGTVANLAEILTVSSRARWWFLVPAGLVTIGFVVTMAWRRRWELLFHANALVAQLGREQRSVPIELPGNVALLAPLLPRRYDTSLEETTGPFLEERFKSLLHEAVQVFGQVVVVIDDVDVLSSQNYHVILRLLRPMTKVDGVKCFLAVPQYFLPAYRSLNLNDLHSSVREFHILGSRKMYEEEAGEVRLKADLRKRQMADYLASLLITRLKPLFPACTVSELMQHNAFKYILHLWGLGEDGSTRGEDGEGDRSELLTEPQRRLLENVGNSRREILRITQRLIVERDLSIDTLCADAELADKVLAKARYDFLRNERMLAKATEPDQKPAGSDEAEGAQPA